MQKFREPFLQILLDKLKDKTDFPTRNDVYIYIQQFFVSNKEYRRRDVDNMAKTMLDLLKNNMYYDDANVKTLLISKEINKQVTQNFAYIAIKKLSGEHNINVLKIAGIERAIMIYNRIKSIK